MVRLARPLMGKPKIIDPVRLTTDLVDDMMVNKTNAQLSDSYVAAAAGQSMSIY